MTAAESACPSCRRRRSTRPKEVAGGPGTTTLSSKDSFLPWCPPLTLDLEEPTSSRPPTWRFLHQVSQYFSQYFSRSVFRSVLQSVSISVSQYFRQYFSQSFPLKCYFIYQLLLQNFINNHKVPAEASSKIRTLKNLHWFRT